MFYEKFFMVEKNKIHRKNYNTRHKNFKTVNYLKKGMGHFLFLPKQIVESKNTITNKKFTEIETNSLYCPNIEEESSKIGINKNTKTKIKK